MCRYTFAATIVLLFPLAAVADKPLPDIADARYGEHELNSYDLWKAKSDTPTPLVVYFHGGGFSSGSKSALSENLLKRLLQSGISVMAADYRLSPQAHYPEHYLDCVRAIQFARAHAGEWNIDPGRIGATGSSAGGCISLWIAFHDDLADAQSIDPILRESSRIRCAAIFSAQSSLDPEVVGQWIGETGRRYVLAKAVPFLGIPATELDSPQTRKLYEAASPISYLTSDDPPVWAFYSQAEIPLAEDASSNVAIHHINFGLRLKERMDDLGVECSIVRPDRPNVMNQAIEFMNRCFDAN